MHAQNGIILIYSHRLISIHYIPYFFISQHMMTYFGRYCEFIIKTVLNIYRNYIKHGDYTNRYININRYLYFIIYCLFFVLNKNIPFDIIYVN